MAVSPHHKSCHKGRRSSKSRRSHDELITLVKEMIARQPALARLLELPLGPADEHPFNPDPFHRQLRYALTRDKVEWIVRELKQMRRMADSYLEAGDSIAAGHIYTLILKETLNQNGYEVLSAGRRSCRVF